MMVSEMRHTHAIQARLASGDIAASPRQDAQTIAWLEHPDDPAARDRFRRWLSLAANTGAIPAEAEQQPYRPQLVLQPAPIWRIDRQDYRAWRDQCPASLLSPEMTMIARWLPPAKQKKSKPPPVPTKAIKARLDAGESVEAIHTATGASKHAIRLVKEKYEIADCPPGPRPRVG